MTKFQFHHSNYIFVFLNPTSTHTLKGTVIHLITLPFLSEQIWYGYIKKVFSFFFIYFHTQMGGYDLGFIQFFYGFLGKKIVLIYYTNGGVRYWIHSNYLAFLNKNKNGLFILRVWFLEVCPRRVVCMAVSQILAFGSIYC